MSELYSVTAGALAFAAATAKTGIEMATGATVTFRIASISFFFDNSAVGNNAKCEIVRYTTTGTGTTYTPLKLNGEAQNKAAISTAKVNDTVEPGTPTVLETFWIPLSGGMVIPWPLGREPYQPVSGFVGLRVTSATAINGSQNIEFEE